MKISDLVTIFFIFLMIIGWLFYYMSFPYWRRKDFREKYTWVGFIVMCKKINKIPKPGKTYAKIASYILGLSPIIFIILLLILKFFNLF